jgi:acyl-CoA synthetase (AMP-forming)/AMP-acid ligase II
MSSEFPPDAVKRQTYISNIHRHLNYPIVLTTDKLHKDYSGLKNLRLLTTSAIEAGLFNPIYSDPGSVFDKTEKDTGVVMVSQSGDGKAKAISLTNGQILASIEGKIQLHSTNKEDIFLAWSGLDHVSNLIEVHLHALCLSAIQVFLPYHLAVSDPMRFLKSLEKYQISYTHVPDFFLKELLKVLNSLAIQVRFEGDPVEMTFDFSKLRALVSQGRLNNSATNSKALELFSKYKAPPRFLRPGFGMTEFCGSAIYDILEPITAVPTSQSLTLTSFFQTVDPKLEPTSQNTIGKPIPTLSVRIVDEDHYALPFGEVGMLELSGPCVFTSYYNDPQRTAKMFTRDGWFRTGDLGVFDTQGRTILSGRYEDRLIIRGKQYHPQNLQKHIRNQNIPGIKARSIVVFCFHPNEIEGDMLDWEAAGVKQENLVVVYATNFPKHMSGTALDTEHRVVGIMVDACGMVPYRILGVEEEQLPKTGGGFGRVSNMLVKRKFLKGGFGL